MSLVGSKTRRAFPVTPRTMSAARSSAGIVSTDGWNMGLRRYEPGSDQLPGRFSREVSTGGFSGSASGAAPKEAAMRSGGGVP